MKTYKWDVFISHATEDKVDVVLPLAKALQKGGIKVWLDNQQLEIGDSLRQKIDEGLAHSRFGIVVLSEYFFQKHWPAKELDGLTARERNGFKVILPVWHRIDANKVSEYSPLLAGILAIKSELGIKKITSQLITLILKHTTGKGEQNNDIAQNIPSSSKLQASRKTKVDLRKFQMKFANGVVFRKSQQYQVAANNFQEIVKYLPKCWPSYLQLASCQISLGQFESAIVNLNKALKFERVKMMVNSYLLEAYFLLGEQTGNFGHYAKSWDLIEHSDFHHRTKEISLSLNKKLDKGWLKKLSFISAASFDRPELPNWEQWTKFESAVKSKIDVCNNCFTIKPPRCKKCNICTRCDFAGGEYCYKHSPADYNSGG